MLAFESLAQVLNALRSRLLVLLAKVLLGNLVVIVKPTYMDFVACSLNAFGTIDLDGFW